MIIFDWIETAMNTPEIQMTESMKILGAIGVFIVAMAVILAIIFVWFCYIAVKGRIDKIREKRRQRKNEQTDGT